MGSCQSSNAAAPTGKESRPRKHDRRRAKPLAHARDFSYSSQPTRHQPDSHPCTKPTMQVPTYWRGPAGQPPQPPPPKVTTAAGYKATSSTAVGIGLRDNDHEAVVVVDVSPTSIFGTTSSIQPGMFVVRINGHHVATADEAVTMLKHAVGSIALECRAGQQSTSSSSPSYNQSPPGYSYYIQV